VERIKRLRKRAGMSLADLAARGGMKPQQVAYIERAGSDPRASTLARVAKALRVPVCAFFDQEGDHEGHGKRHRRRTR